MARTKQDKAIDERALAAVKVFRQLQPTLTGFARAFTGNKRIRVEAHASLTGTDGDVIYFRVPYSLAKMGAHQRTLCGKRNPEGHQMCNACNERELVMVTIYHEISHVVSGSVEKLSNERRVKLVKQSIRYLPDYVAKSVWNKINNAPETDRESYGHVSEYVSPWLNFLNNCFEDARVDAAMYQARPGTYAMKLNQMNYTRQDGVEQGDGTVLFWYDYPVNSQVCLGTYFMASGMDPTGWFSDEVSAVLADEELQSICHLGEGMTADAVYIESTRALARLWELGYLDPPTPPEPPPPPAPEPPPEEEEEDEESEPEQQEQEQDSDPQEEEEPEEEGQGQEEEPEEEGQGQEEEPEEEGQGQEEEPEEEGQGEAQDDGSDDDSQDETGQGDGDTQDTEADTDEPDEQEGGDGGGDDGSGSGQDEEAGDASGGDTEESSREDQDADPEDSDSGGAGGDGSEGGAGSDTANEQQPGEGDGEGDDTGGEGDTEVSDVPAGDGGDFEDGNDSTDAGGEGGQVEGQGTVEEARELFDEATHHDTPLYEIDPEADEEITVGVPQDEADTATEQRALDRAIMVGWYFEEMSTGVSLVREHRYDTRDEYAEAWSDKRSDLWEFLNKGSVKHEVSEYVPGEVVLGPALLRMRAAFADNQRWQYQRNLKSGRIAGRVLGKRAVHDDPRLFQAKRMPGKRSYQVQISMDVSGSTANGNLELEKRAVMAQAELLHRTGIPFSIIAHSADLVDGRSYNEGMSLEIYHVKEESEPWDARTKHRLATLNPHSGNLDGHVLEWLRRCADRSNATDKIILYYSDGKFPASNGPEEREILYRELATVKQRGYTLLGVGIRTLSPEEHGMKTVEVNDDSDVVRVVRQLEEVLR